MITTLLFVSLFAPPDASGVLESAFSGRDFALSANADSEQWRSAPGVKFDHDYLARPVSGPPTEVRSRWTKTHLYLLYICPYTELNLKQQPTQTEETPRLWNWDVGELFIGSQTWPVGRYRELQVSPQGEWVDLDIDREHPKEQGGMSWNSGYTVKARIDVERKIWFGEMRIPFAALDTPSPEKGNELRAGIYRIAGTGDNRQFYAWRPTGQTSFHVPQAFGTVRLR